MLRYLSGEVFEGDGTKKDNDNYEKIVRICYQASSSENCNSSYEHLVLILKLKPQWQAMTAAMQ